MSSKIQASTKKTYKEMLGSTISFHIPTFQRSYNWKPKQVTQLWESIVANEEHYYIGNIVVVQHSTQEIESGFLVIDGQQRLTTLALFLIAIRNFIQKDKQKTASKRQLSGHQKLIEEIERELVYKSSFSDELSNNKLKLTFSKKNLRDCYEKLVFGREVNIEQLDESQQRFVRNLNVASRLLAGYIKDGPSVKKLIDLLYKKITMLEFILIECRNENDVYTIFEGLNSTGLELSVVDLVKNVIFKVISSLDDNSNQLDEAERVWKEMESVFEQSNLSLFSKFLRHRWISINGYINTAYLYDRMKKDVESISSTSEAMRYVNDLKNDGELYVAIRTGNKEYLMSKGICDSEKLCELIKRFKYLDADQVYEVILSYCKKYVVESDYTEQQFSRDLKILWNFGFQTKILSSINPSKYEQLFADRCKEISLYRGKNFSKESKNFYSKLALLLKDRENEYIDNFGDVLEYKEGNNDNNELLRIVLSSIYGKVDNGVRGVVYETTTIEHILPRSIYKNEPFVHKIGNLTILSDPENKSASNHGFAIKFKKHFSRDIFKHNRELDRYDFESDDLRSVVQERAKDLALESRKVFEVLY